ncbi:hypothetical protein CDFC105_84004 [Clostridioides difficile]|nr:hypothetical protein CDFC105_84004 [Clostridioides difficile]
MGSEMCIRDSDNVANSLINNKFARRVDKVECKELLHQAYEHNLVQCGENVRKGVTFICNCCGCCCEALVAAKRFGNLHPVPVSYTHLTLPTTPYV